MLYSYLCSVLKQNNSRHVKKTIELTRGNKIKVIKSFNAFAFTQICARYVCSFALAILACKFAIALDDVC